MEIQKTAFTTHFSEGNTSVSKDDITKLNSIFTECDVDGNGVLQNDEVPNFQKAVMTRLGHLWNAVRDFIDVIAGEAVQQPQGSQIRSVECHRSEEEQRIYKEKLAEAKTILIDNAEKLGLTQDEINYFNKFDIESNLESITEGPARYDRNSDNVIFNINDSWEPNTGNFIKILIHEITHGVKKNDEYTQSQELACENRGTEVAKKAFDAGLIDDFVVWGDENGMYKISDLDGSKKQTYLNNWIKNYSHLP